MNIFDKLKRSWWVILSFLGYINGLGFLYIGFKNNNRDWVLEGIIYEIPWLFSLIFFKNEAISQTFVVISIIVLFISIIRSIWVAIKLADIYENEEKYTIRQTDVGKQKENDLTKNLSVNMCCLCVGVVVIVFALMAMML